MRFEREQAQVFGWVAQAWKIAFKMISKSKLLSNAQTCLGDHFDCIDP